MATKAMDATQGLCPCGQPATHRWEGRRYCLNCKRDIMRAWFHKHGAWVVASALADCGIVGARIVTACDGPITQDAVARVEKGSAKRTLRLLDLDHQSPGLGGLPSDHDRCQVYDLDQTTVNPLTGSAQPLLVFPGTRRERAEFMAKAKQEGGAS